MRFRVTERHSLSEWNIEGAHYRFRAEVSRGAGLN